MDLAIGTIGSLVTVMITPLVAILLKCEDGGPVFYRSEFVDCDGNVRYYLKFRTMQPNADQVLRDSAALKREFDQNFKLKDDPRVLKIGRILRKYSIDEFPQFFSLLTGRLTFVGPRTISRDEVTRYGSSISKLLSVKPGMTGYWQVMGRQLTTYEERIRLDMYYIDHWSIWLDLAIIVKTFWKVPHGDGAF